MTASIEIASGQVVVPSSTTLIGRWRTWPLLNKVVALAYAPIFVHEIPFALGLNAVDSVGDFFIRSFALLSYATATLLLLTWVALTLTKAAFKRSPEHLRKSVLGAVLVTCLFFAGPYVAQRLHAFGFYLIGRRAEPVIVAMESYVAKYGQPPHHISQLMPEFLCELPKGVGDLHLQEWSVYDPNRPNDWSLDITRTLGLPIGTEILTYQSHGLAEPGERLGRWVLRFKRHI